MTTLKTKQKWVPGMLVTKLLFTEMEKGGGGREVALNLKDKSAKETTWFRNRATEQKRASEREYEDKRKRQRHRKSKERLREGESESLGQRA